MSRSRVESWFLTRRERGGLWDIGPHALAMAVRNTTNYVFPEIVENARADSTVPTSSPPAFRSTTP